MNVCYLSMENISSSVRSWLSSLWQFCQDTGLFFLSVTRVLKKCSKCCFRSCAWNADTSSKSPWGERIKCPFQVCLQVLGCSLNYSSIWYLQWPVCAASNIMQYSYTDFCAFFGRLRFLHDINMQFCPKFSPDTEHAGAEKNNYIRVWWTCASVGALPF